LVAKKADIPCTFGWWQFLHSKVILQVKLKLFNIKIRLNAHKFQETKNLGTSLINGSAVGVTVNMFPDVTWETSCVTENMLVKQYPWYDKFLLPTSMIL
jgi:hypothetical protein